MNCKKCGTTIPDGVAFCGECGYPSDDRTLCPSCKKPSEKGLKFCVHCGTHLEESDFCRWCGQTIRAGSEFCRFCGQQAAKAPVAPVKPKTRLIRGGKLKDNKIFKLVKCWTMTGIFLLAFCFSFFAYPKTTVTVKEGGQSQKVEMSGNPFKAVEALFYFTKDYDEVMDEFQEAMADVDDSGKIIKINYNYLKLEAAMAGGQKDADGEVITKADFTKIFLMIAQALIPVALLILCLVFLILSVMQSLRVTNQNEETNDKRDIKGFAVISALLIAGLILSKIQYAVGLFGIMDIASVKTSVVLNGFGAWMLILSILALAFLTVGHYIFTDAEINIPKLISQGVSIIMLVLAVIFWGGSIVKNPESKGMTMSLSYFWTALNQYFIESKIVATIILILSILVFLCFLAYFVKAFYAALSKSVEPAPKSNAINSVVLAAISLILIVLTVIGMSLINKKEGSTVVKLTAGPIVATVLCVINMIQSFVFTYYRGYQPAKK